MSYSEYMAKFDAVKVKNDIVDWIHNWFNDNGKDCNAIIGISGGKDSSVVAALCVEALGKDRVIGILMPNHSQSDIGDAYKLVDHLDIMHTVINVGQAIDNLSNHINSLNLLRLKHKAEKSITMSRQAIVNLPPRIRMATLYAFSQSLNGRVAKDEVIAVGKACGLPTELVEKVPADGLCGKTDEDNLGFTYRVLNEYIRTGVCENEGIKERIDAKHKANLFKLKPMPVFDYSPTI